MLDFVEKMRMNIAEYFCEDVNTFKLEECIYTFRVFCEKFKKAVTVSRRFSLRWLLEQDIPLWTANVARWKHSF